MGRGVFLPLNGKEVQEVLRDVWKRFLQKSLKALLVPIESEGFISPGLIGTPDGIERTRAFAPYIPINTARILQMLTKLEPPSEPIGVVARPCEIRAAIELRKLKQVAEKNLVFLAIDCLGTYSLRVYQEKLQEGKIEEVQVDQSLIRDACKVCTYPVVPWSDLRVFYLGIDEGIFLEALTEEGERLLKESGFEFEEKKFEKRERVLSELLEKRTLNENELLHHQQEELKGYEALLREFSVCIKCHNCMTVCPICYCKECFFNSPSFEFEADRFLNLLELKGVLRLPTEILLFHLTRMAHMALSCVGCGMCEEGCPQGIRVFELFKAVAKKVQGIFQYEPGRDPKEALPLTTFREEELKEVESRLHDL